MTLKRSLPLLLLATLLLGATGCDSNPTNAPSDAEIKSADAKRAAAIDADPSMSAEQKATMKAHLGLGGDAPADGPKR